MSVMLLDAENAGNLIKGICQFSQMWNCSSFLSHDNTGRLNSLSVTKFVKDLYKANIDTWNRKYNENDKLIFNTTETESIDKYQTLKILQCLHYNIEIEYVPEAKRLIDQLEIMIYEMYRIIANKKNILMRNGVDIMENFYWRKGNEWDDNLKPKEEINITDLINIGEYHVCTFCDIINCNEYIIVDGMFGQDYYCKNKKCKY